MNRIWLSLIGIFATASISAQTDSLLEEFNNVDKNRIENYSKNLTVNTSNKEFEIVAQNKTKWDGVNLLINTVDLSTYPLIAFKIKSNANVTVRIDLIEKNGTKTLVSNAIALSKSVFGDGKWNYIFFDFTGHFNQMWPEPAALNPKNISGLSIGLNPGAPFTGTVVIDSISMGRAAKKPSSKTDRYINVNQIGFYPESEKIAVVNGATQDIFSIVTTDTKKAVYNGKLTDAQYWPYSDETVRKAVFSDFKQTGTYMVFVPGLGYSYPFRIEKSVFSDIATSSIKAFYYQRASCELKPEFAGKWARPAGQPDTAVYLHPSAASAERPADFKFSSPRGWYDAGDYNKYIVNCGITMYSLLSILEQYPSYANSIKLNIPESKNNLPDFLDELLWNLRWMLTMQDNNDGGVYHKLTHENFEPMELPGLINLKRYVMPKSTAASLDFCAVMAQAARALRPFSKELPGLADTCMKAAMKAWTWAKLNPKVYYDQYEINNKFKPIVYTGTYADGMLFDEFEWAATELLISTGNELFLNDIHIADVNYKLPNWSNVQTLGLLSLVRYRNFVAKQIDTNIIKKKFLELVDPALQYDLSSPFHISMGHDKTDYEWGSNSNAANLSMLLLQAYYLTKNKQYYNAALDNFDYLLGRNAIGYCFVSGKGSKWPAFLHHRPSEADGIPDPIPGLLVGGPQPGREDKCVYEWSAPAKNYSDDVCSYSTNEVAINWNAPLAFVACAFEAGDKNLDREPATNPRSKLVFPDLSKVMKASQIKPSDNNPIIIMPNLTTGLLRTYLAIVEPSQVEVRDASNKILLTETIEELGSVVRLYNLNLKTGTYTISLRNNKNFYTKTFIINRP